VVRQLMLQSVIVTVNSLGLQSLRLEEDDRQRAPRGAVPADSFWAVVDSADLAEVHRVLLAAQPEAAFCLLSERARSIGRLLD